MRGFVEITATAKINGDMTVNQISVEQGAIINGNLTMKKGSDAGQSGTEK